MIHLNRNRQDSTASQPTNPLLLSLLLIPPSLLLLREVTPFGASHVVMAVIMAVRPSVGQPITNRRIAGTWTLLLSHSLHLLFYSIQVRH